MDDDLFTVVWFTDAHNQPGMSQERFIWLSRFTNEIEPDALIDGGDFDDFRSLCGHERNETLKARDKPSIKDDLEHSASARALINQHLDVPVKKYAALGNHDDERLLRYENEHPEVAGMLFNQYTDIHKHYGWEVIRYREYLTLHGVDFTHVPMNGLNKALGGKRCCVNVATQSNADICFGHTHSYAYWEEHKLGPYPGRSTVAINGGCFMPDGYVADYAKGGQKRAWYGCHVVRIDKETRRIAEHAAVTMRELADRYAD
jgi:predicted MPP superfamily phosphohydrolase